MEKIVGYTGGETKGNRWPHPMNDDFNKIIKNAVKIYGIGQKSDEELLIKCKEYLRSRIKGIIDHKIRRDTEEYFRAMNLEITHGVGKSVKDQQQMIQDCSFVMCVGDWSSDEGCLQQYRQASMYSKPIFSMRYEKQVPLKSLVRYLQPVRPIKDAAWDQSKQDDLLVYEDSSGLLEVIDGNHRHEFANRVGGVNYLSAWIIKQI